ncbi:CD83 antigen [Rhinatrema bivittatum]|uniref:CD83 antigen n=1 Tax=Rhinatrema bivittatum TaxID=194408 RepID=UPI00112B9E75|nr:CD83 antigen [Rhinatrema bivittatum]
MHPKWYLKSLLLQNIWYVIHAATVEVVCTEDAVLPCVALQDPDISYRAITWYKVNGSSEELGLVARRKFLNNTESYFEDSVEITSSNMWALKIKNTTAFHSGIYKCQLWAPVGKPNTCGVLRLTVTGCPDQEENEISRKHILEIFLVSITVVFGLFLMFLNYKCIKIQTIFSTASKKWKNTCIFPTQNPRKGEDTILGNNGA